MFTRNFSIAAAALTVLGLASISAVADDKATQQVQQMQQVTIDQQAATAKTRAPGKAVPQWRRRWPEVKRHEPCESLR